MFKIFHNESLEKHTTLAKLPWHHPEEGISLCSPPELRAGCSWGSGWRQVLAQMRLRRGLGVRVALKPALELLEFSFSLLSPVLLPEVFSYPVSWEARHRGLGIPTLTTLSGRGRKNWESVCVSLLGNPDW